MKKILVVLLILVMSLSMVACGKSVDEKTSTKVTESGAEETTETSEEQPSEVTSSFQYSKIMDYKAPTEITRLAGFDNISMDEGDVPLIAFMPSATEFTYIMAIGKGVYDTAEKVGAEVITLAPQSGKDVAAQVGMLQDAISQGVDAIIINSHDDGATAPLLEEAVAKGIMVVIVNSDFADYPTNVHAVVGYKQYYGTSLIGEYAIEKMAGEKAVVGIIEGLPGYHSTERVGGFVDAIAGEDNFEIVSSLSGDWNTEGGLRAATDMLQANSDINVIFCANDHEAIGAVNALFAAGKQGEVMLLGNDGDTEALERINSGEITATVNTTPYVMGQIALQVVIDGLTGNFDGGYVETPLNISDQDNALGFLQEPEKLHPKPSKEY